MSTLSGGERSRVSLTKMLLSGANTLILDEPTNHLDLEGKEALESALREYEGTIIFVSHDRYFIDNVTDKIIEIEGGAATEYICSYTELAAKKTQKAEDAARFAKKETAVKPAASAAQPSTRPRSLYYLERKIAEVEEEIAGFEEKSVKLEKLLNDPELYYDHVRAKDAQDEFDVLKKKLHEKYDEWDDLQGQLQDR